MLFQTVATGESLFWQGLVFSTFATSITAFAIWWVFISRVKSLAKPVETKLSSTLMMRIALLVGFSGLCRYAGSVWDISEHVITGVVPGGEDFLWPPHMIIYFSFLISLIVALFSILTITKPYRAKGIMDPRYAIRDYPFLGAIVIAGLYAWMSVPGDALWHELYGIELTSWSPPHVMLIIASAAETISAAGLLINSQEVPSLWKKLVSIFIISIALNELYVIATTDWEVPIQGGPGLAIVTARPIWMFPVVAAGCAILLFQLARNMTGLRFAGTLTAVGFYALRFLGMGWISSIDGVPLNFPLLFILGILLMEALDFVQIKNSTVNLISQATIFSLGYVALSYPVLERLPDVFTFTATDYVLTFLATSVVSALLILGSVKMMGWFTGAVVASSQQRISTQPASGD